MFTLELMARNTPNNDVLLFHYPLVHASTPTISDIDPSFHYRWSWKNRSCLAGFGIQAVTVLQRYPRLNAFDRLDPKAQVKYLLNRSLAHRIRQRH